MTRTISITGTSSGLGRAGAQHFHAQGFEVNVVVPLATIQAVLPHLRARRSGTIVNISSIGGRVTFPLGALYNGSKFALEGLSEALWYELDASAYASRSSSWAG